MRVVERQEKFTLFEDDVNPDKKSMVVSGARVNYDTGAGFESVDLTARRVNNQQINGYLCTANQFSYAFQTEDTGQEPIGTVGFGYRGHWFKFRLNRVGYLHWPTRTLQPIGVAADYSSPVTVTRTQAKAGPDLITTGATLTWPGLWTTPGGGSIDAVWEATPTRIKEDIIVNQAAREWIAANAPPTTPANETYFGFRFELDLSDVPRIKGHGKNDDFDDDLGGIQLNDISDELIAFLPVDFAHVEGRGGRVRLRKRFYRTGNQNYLFVAALVSDIASLLPGDIHFDPTVTDHPTDADLDTVYSQGTTTYQQYNNRIYMGEYNNTVETLGVRWDGFAQIDAGSTIDSCSIELYVRAQTNNPDVDIFGDKGSTSSYNLANDGPYLSNITETTANTNWTTWSNGQYNTTPDLADEMQEILDTLGSLTACRFSFEGNATPSTNADVGCDYNGAANEPLLNVSWTTSGPGTDVLAADDVEAASEVSSPALGQEHSLVSTDVESASEVSSPSLGIASGTDALLAEDVESASETGTPAVGQRHILLAEDVESASEANTPAVGQRHILAATDVESVSEVTSPAVNQIVGLLAEDVESASEVSNPVLDTNQDDLFAVSVTSTSEVSRPVLSDGTEQPSAGFSRNLQRDLCNELVVDGIR